MSLTNMLTTQEEIFDVSGADDNNVARFISGSAKVDNYGIAYVARTGAATLHLVARQGGIGTVNLIISPKSQDGTVLPDVIRQYVISDPPTPPPQATHAVISGVHLADKSITTPPDPNVDTVQF